MPNALIWGVLGGLMRFIPLLGVWIAAGPPLILAAGVVEGWGVFIPPSSGYWF